MHFMVSNILTMFILP